MNPKARFAILYVIFLAVAAGLFHVYNISVSPEYTHPYGWASFAVFASITGIVHFFLLSAAEKDPKAFVRGFMAVNTIKIFLYLAFLVVFVLFFRTGAVVFIAEFAAFYLIFTVFEITLLYRYLLPKRT